MEQRAALSTGAGYAHVGWGATTPLPLLACPALNAVQALYLIRG